MDADRLEVGKTEGPQREATEGPAKGRPLGEGMSGLRIMQRPLWKEGPPPRQPVLSFVQLCAALWGWQEVVKGKGQGSARRREEACPAQPSIGNRLGVGAARPRWWCGAESNTPGPDAGDASAPETRG